MVVLPKNNFRVWRAEDFKIYSQRTITRCASNTLWRRYKLVGNVTNPLNYSTTDFAERFIQTVGEVWVLRSSSARSSEIDEQIYYPRLKFLNRLAITARNSEENYIQNLYEPLVKLFVNFNNVNFDLIVNFNNDWLSRCNHYWIIIQEFCDRFSDRFSFSGRSHEKRKVFTVATNHSLLKMYLLLLLFATVAALRKRYLKNKTYLYDGY